MTLFASHIASYLKQLNEEIVVGGATITLPQRDVLLVLHPMNNPYQSKNTHLQTIHIWEDMWHNKQDVVKSRLASVVGKTERIHARKTHLIKMSNPDLIQFLSQNHLNQAIPAKYKFGLTFKDELVAVAAFSSVCPVHRQGKRYNSHQLLRFCTKNGYSVVGGLSKLLSHFVKYHGADDVMTYADLDWSVGKGYEKLGFKKIDLLPPQQFSINSASYERTYYPKENFPENTTLYSNQGSVKYVLDLSNT